MTQATVSGGRTPGSSFSGTTSSNLITTENLNAISSASNQVTITGNGTAGSSFANTANIRASSDIDKTLEEISNQKVAVEELYDDTVIAKNEAVAAKNTAQNLLSGLTDIPFNLGNATAGDLLYYNGTSISPLEQIEVTDGGNF